MFKIYIALIILMTAGIELVVMSTDDLLLYSEDKILLHKLMFLEISPQGTE